jgi:guanine nucleotide-binding protein G(i) subunit alpha
MKMYEDNTTNRYEESLALFQEIVQSPFFIKSSIVLIFNKMDLLENKVLLKDMKEYFPDYEGGKNVVQACLFIRQKYMDMIDRGISKVLFTTATEDEKMVRIWEELRTIIINHKD